MRVDFREVAGSRRGRDKLCRGSRGENDSTEKMRYSSSTEAGRESQKFPKIFPAASVGDINTSVVNDR